MLGDWDLLGLTKRLNPPQKTCGDAAEGLAGTRAMSSDVELSNNYCVYCFFRNEGRVGEPVYIGMGAPSRPAQHVKYAKSGRPAKIYHNPRLILLMRRSFKRGIGIPPLVIIKTGLTQTQAAECEMALIAAIGRKATGGGPLYNITAGGEGFDEETSRRSVAARAELFSTDPEWAAKQRAHFAKGRAKMATLRKSDPSWNADQNAKTAQNIAKGRAKKDRLRIEDEAWARQQRDNSKHQLRKAQDVLAQRRIDDTEYAQRERENAARGRETYAQICAENPDKRAERNEAVAKGRATMQAHFANNDDWAAKQRKVRASNATKARAALTKCLKDEGWMSHQKVVMSNAREAKRKLWSEDNEWSRKQRAFVVCRRRASRQSVILSALLNERGVLEPSTHPDFIALVKRWKNPDTGCSLIGKENDLTREQIVAELATAPRSAP